MFYIRTGLITQPRNTPLFISGAINIPACPIMNGNDDFPCFQTFKLVVLNARMEPPNRTPVLRVVKFLENIKPKSPPARIRPPVNNQLAIQYVAL